MVNLVVLWASPLVKGPPEFQFFDKLTRVHLDHGDTPFPDTLILRRQARGNSVALTHL